MEVVVVVNFLITHLSYFSSKGCFIPVSVYTDGTVIIVVRGGVEETQRYRDTVTLFGVPVSDFVRSTNTSVLDV